MVIPVKTPTSDKCETNFRKFHAKVDKEIKILKYNNRYHNGRLQCKNKKPARR